MLKKIGLLMSLILIMLGASGCTTGGLEEKEMNENRVFTENQLSILRAAGVREERLEGGELVASEETLLAMLDQAQAYLEEKYPQETFSFTGLDNSAPRVSLYQFHVAAGDETFAVQVKRMEDGSLQISDSYFSDLKRAQLNALVEEKLAEAGLRAKADLEIAGLYDRTFTAELPLEQTLANGGVIAVYGWAFASGDVSLEQILPGLEDKLCDAGLCGGFQLRLVEGVTPEQAFEASRTDKTFAVQECYVSLPEKSSEVK